MTAVDQDALQFEGEPVTNRKLTVKGEVPMNGRARLKRHETFALVGRAKIEDIAFKDVSGVATRVHGAALEEAVLVPDELVEDVIEEDRQTRTGVMRLLSLEGERRRAARHALWERNRGGDECGFDSDYLDGLDAILGAAVLCDHITEKQLQKIAALIPTFDETPTIDWYETVEREFTQAAAVMLSGVEWARRHLAEAHEAERLRVEEIQRQAREAARQATAVHDNPDDTPAAQMSDTVTADPETGEVIPPDEAD